MTTDELYTAVAHSIIIGGVAASVVYAKQAKNLVKIQQDTIATLKDNVEALESGFKNCKKRLVELQKLIKE